jgi:polar amino acid transport system substrate-binding protein
MRTRPTRLLIGSAALLMLAGACSKSDTTSTTATTATPSGSTPGTTAKPTSAISTPKGTGVKQDPAALAKKATLVASGKLTICSDIPYAPFEFPDAKNEGKYTGFDVQVAEAMAKTMDLTAEWKITPFDSIIPALAAGNCDAIVSATTIKPERAEKVDFTQPYFNADQSLLILKKDEGTYKTLADLKGQTIGVQSGTTGADYANAHKPEGATIKEYPGADDLFGAIASGDIQAVLQDYPVNAYRALQNTDQFAVTETFVTGEQYGMATAKSNPNLNAAMNAALERVGESGQYDTIYVTWFGAPK